MNFGDGFPIPQEKDHIQSMGSWMPITPVKLIPTRSNPAQFDRYVEPLGEVNWLDLAEFPGGYIQETASNTGVVPNLGPVGQVGQTEGCNGRNISLADRQRIMNHIAASYTQSLNNVDGGWNNNQLARMLERTNTDGLTCINRNPDRSRRMGNQPQLHDSHSQPNNWRESNLSHLLIHDQAQHSGSNLLRSSNNFHQVTAVHYSGLDMLRNNESFNQTPQADYSSSNLVQNGENFQQRPRAHYSSANLLQNDNSFQQIPQYGFPVTYQHTYKKDSSPRAEAHAALKVTAKSPFSRVTRDSRKKLENNQISMGMNLPMAESASADKDNPKSLVVSIGNEAIQHNRNELLQNVVPSMIDSIPPEENKDSESANNRDIDLNKTPQQKLAKRRKHRPKVVKEGKPKRTPKAETSKSINPGGKRKYVRRKGQEESANQKEDVTRNTTGANAKPVETSCRRALNFDSETHVNESQVEPLGHHAGMQQSYKKTFNLNLDFQDTEIESRTYSPGETKSTMLISQQNGLRIGNQKPGTVQSHTSMVDPNPAYTSTQERLPVAISLPQEEDLHMENTNVIAGKVDTTLGCPFQQNHRGHTPIQQHTSGKGIYRTLYEEENFQSLDRTRKLMTQTFLQPTPMTLFSSKENGRSKREYSKAMEQRHPSTVSQIASSFLNQNVFQIDGCHKYASINGAGCSETHKKKKIDNGLRTIITDRSSSITTTKDGLREAQRKIISTVSGSEFMLEANSNILKSCFKSSNLSNKEQSRYNKLFCDWDFQSMASEKYSCTEKMGDSTMLTSIHAYASSNPSKKCDLFPWTPHVKSPAPGDRRPKSYCANGSVKQTMQLALTKSIPSQRDQVQLAQTTAFFDHQQYSAKREGSAIKQKNPMRSLDEIIHSFKCLNLNGSENQVQYQEQHAIVPYKQDGAVVPYEGFEFIKKRKPRPKVDLDPETNRIWNLLMGKEGSEGIEETDKKKEKWWEEERRVFKGRADSFIARMHLVQGDRRFSRWKGSVVDSVIGVFLTQNVSDHLSSSAFMSLAARFPLKSNKRTCDVSCTKILVEEPEEVCVQSENESIQWHEQLLRHLPNSQSSITTHEPTDYHRESETSGVKKTSLLEPHFIGLEEEIISSQESFGSTILQSNGIRSYSGSNSEAEDSPPTCKVNSGLENFQQIGTTLFQDFDSCINDSSRFQKGYHRFKQSEDRGNFQQESRLDSIDNLESSLTFTQLLNFNSPQNEVLPSSDHELHMTSCSELLEADSYEIYNGECISSLPSDGSEFPMVKNGCYARTQQVAEDIGETTFQQLSTPHKVLLEKHPMQQPGAQYGCQPKNNQSCSEIYQHEKNMTFQCESISITEPVHHAEKNDSRQHVPSGSKHAEKACSDGEKISSLNNLCNNKLINPNAGGQVLSTHKVFDETSPSISKSKKRKADSINKNATDWDSLRKQVRGTNRVQERSKDTMDSLDYEALRCANVKEISDAIRERGMNNMLAERMKDFLNRLVMEHGSIDLEWLRDVPPDDAKDFLLSIRGLGLKSVECVRLLTLHHLAFPVDTNVGRIAVRLGWVPLQPLPESLQLHLLELYPILESIQKYLWPRLCRLDQRTLYELHYQLITFGKVFCTKSKPNCNACPMRGECRHFASAFASARLALPGPEEKSVVSSTMPMMAERSPAVGFNPMPLPSPEKSMHNEIACEIGQCVPIIEEPATPEQYSAKLTESDIEDAFYEDPDEIPIIKLDIEEFTVNLQNYMQEKMELQGCDMSKALVALNTDAASIPAPKLKNVSRLRTEHQVYELPDSHPLLEGMDTREPDDPSPYLLAIWTPGETADSVQPPECRCVSQESGKLCDDKTCFSCNDVRETNSQTVRGTLLIPCRTAMRGSFPLNGTYFQVNEVFADHDSSLNPIDVPREWIWNLPRRMVNFGTSVSSIFKGLSTEGIQFCFWKGFVCVRGFDQKLRAPRPLMARLHFPASKSTKARKGNKP